MTFIFINSFSYYVVCDDFYIMSRQIGSDIYGVFRGLQMVSSEFFKLQEKQVKHVWVNSSLRNTITESAVFPKNIDLQKSLVDVGIIIFFK